MEGYLSTKSFDVVKNYLLTESDSHSNVLEPFSTLFGLSILSIKPIGTKLLVSGNQIYFQEPTFYQGPMRWVFGAKRDDITFIKMPLLYALTKYDKDNDQHVYLFRRALDGLKRLKVTYSKTDGLVILQNIDHYILLIENRIERDAENRENIGVIYNCFNDLWTDDEIDIIFKLFKLCEVNDLQHYYIYSIESLIKSKEKKIEQIILNNLY
tara:strand:+ start:1415 stop:2047 length:633 start_codon:yes stop_codon:yes gene_type:complete